MFGLRGKIQLTVNNIHFLRMFYFIREDGFQKDENTFNDIRFEEASILYNIGAIYSRLGALEIRKTHEAYVIKFE